MIELEAEARIDYALIARVLANDDPLAFGELVRRHQGMVRAQLRGLMRRDYAGADDVAQDTFLTAWRKLPQFRGNARFSTWLYRIAYSRFLHSLRKRNISAEEVSQPEAEESSSALETVDLQLDIERAMQHLSLNEQQVLLHCVLLGLSHEEVAYVLDMPLGTVKTHALRGKAKLRIRLADWHQIAAQEVKS